MTATTDPHSLHLNSAQTIDVGRLVSDDSEIVFEIPDVKSEQVTRTIPGVNIRDRQSLVPPIIPLIKSQIQNSISSI